MIIIKNLNKKCCKNSMKLESRNKKNIYCRLFVSKLTISKSTESMTEDLSYIISYNMILEKRLRLLPKKLSNCIYFIHNYSIVDNEGSKRPSKFAYYKRLKELCY